eukprot:TRINITY_DN11755_c0_g1_i1.p1 TRINITY_DN11755_c0_g1~~TRINITY_DN11755_c0_g1_i1.p1  ORF type:complete len:299 (-),score=43.87 TRINITY_DN11755_c0_g1_i1:100-996(-)
MLRECSRRLVKRVDKSVGLRLARARCFSAPTTHFDDTDPCFSKEKFLKRRFDTAAWYYENRNRFINNPALNGKWMLICDKEILAADSSSMNVRQAQGILPTTCRPASIVLKVGDEKQSDTAPVIPLADPVSELALGSPSLPEPCILGTTHRIVFPGEYERWPSKEEIHGKWVHGKEPGAVYAFAQMGVAPSYAREYVNVTFLLDTGAPHTFLTDDTLRKLGFRTDVAGLDARSFFLSRFVSFLPVVCVKRNLATDVVVTFSAGLYSLTGEIRICPSKFQTAFSPISTCWDLTSCAIST